MHKIEKKKKNRYNSINDLLILIKSSTTTPPMLRARGKCVRLDAVGERLPKTMWSRQRAHNSTVNGQCQGPLFDYLTHKHAYICKIQTRTRRISFFPVRHFFRARLYFIFCSGGAKPSALGLPSTYPRTDAQLAFEDLEDLNGRCS